MSVMEQILELADGYVRGSQGKYGYEGKYMGNGDLHLTFLEYDKRGKRKDIGKVIASHIDISEIDAPVARVLMDEIASLPPKRSSNYNHLVFALTDATRVMNVQPSGSTSSTLL